MGLLVVLVHQVRVDGRSSATEAGGDYAAQVGVGIAICVLDRRGGYILVLRMAVLAERVEGVVSASLAVGYPLAALIELLFTSIFLVEGLR
jgi:hypothetical protein